MKKNHPEIKKENVICVPKLSENVKCEPKIGYKGSLRRCWICD